jgi:hypothetical protein
MEARMSGFQFVALPREPFAPLFDQAEAELTALHARRVVVNERPGFPCRVSLADAEVGEAVLLLSYTHHDVASPYHASGPIYVRQGVRTARPAVGEIPLMFRHRLLSLRAYDREAMLINAAAVTGTELEPAIGELFADPAVAYLHVHNARPGCYNCRVDRA